jgi:hypothetical protein
VKPQDSGTEWLFRSKLKNFINLRHEMARLTDLTDWEAAVSTSCPVL